MAQDKITEIFDIGLLNDNKTKFLNLIKEALSDVEKLGQAIKTTTSIGGSSDNSAKAAKSINEISFNLKAFNDLLKQNETLMAKYNALTSDAARENVALKARLSELSKELDNVQEKRKQDATNTKLSNEIKAASDARYIKMYESLIKEKEDLENKAAAAEKERINQSMIARQKSSDARKREIAEQGRLASEAAALEKKEAAENKVAEKNVEALNSAYVKLNQQHKSAVMIYQQYAVTLGETNKLTIQAKDNANRLGEQLRSVDAGVGNFKRNVGNYSSAWNGLGMSIQQVAREMPNFAQSMQLGFLAISNNLPILADELKRAKDNIAALKKEGKDAPSLFSQIASSVFSWQTLLTIGITLLVKYGAEIVDWATNVSNAEKIMRSYEKALSDTIKSESEGISKLVAAKQAINDNSVSRGTQIKLLNEAKAAYPQLLSSLDIELNTIDEINAALQQQMDIRIGIAKTKAAEATLGEATAEQIKAFQELNKEATNWEIFIKAFSIGSRTYEEFSNTLTESTKKLAAAVKQDYDNRVITTVQYKVQMDKIEELSNAQKKEAAAVDLVRYATDDLTMAKVKEIDKLEKERTEKEKAIKMYPSLEKVLNAEINKINKTITSLQGEISEREKLLNLKQARVASFGISEEERQLIEAQNYARTFKEGTRQRLDADIAAKKVELKITLKALQEKENVNVSYLKGDLNFNQKYATLREEAISKNNDEILRMQDAFNKKQAKAAKAGKGKETDLSEFDAKKRLIKAEADLDRERFEQSIATNKAIADNQDKYFTLRIQAEDDIATKQYEQAKRTFEEKISLLENEERAIEKIRGKKEKTQAEEQKVSKNNTDAILAEKKLAEEEFVKTTLYIQGENQKQITKIYEQEVNKRLSIINGQLDAVQISGDNEKRVALEALKERFMAGEMKIKEYRAKAQTLEEEYDNKTLQSKKKVIEKELFNFTQSEEVRTELKGKYNKLNETIEKNEFDSFVRTEDEKQKLREQIAQKQVELATEVANMIATINRAQNEQEIRDFEKKKELLQQNTELEMYAIEQSSVGESEKAALKKVLAAETFAKEQEIANQIAEIRRKQALADKAQALFSIALNTAIAVSQINASPAVNADPTQILRATLTKLVIGLGAVQAGIVLATPLPQYAKGKKASDGYEGLAIAGEKGTEMKIDKDGSLQLLTKPTLIHTKRGDTILSNKELMSGELGKHIKTGKEKANYDELIKAYSYHTDRTIKAIKNSPSNIIIDNSNYNLSLKRARV